MAFSSTATITGNTYTGKGAGNWLDYAFEVGRNSTAAISGNTVSGNTGVASADGSTSAGIIVTTYYDGSGTHSGATITNNIVTGNTEGISVGYDSSDVSIVVAHNNNLSGNITDDATSTAPTVNATNNWWGSADKTAVLSHVSGNITFDPWYTDAGMTTLSSGNASLTSTTVGQADLPTGATAVVLTDTTVLDLSNATTSETSNVVTVDGNAVTLTQSVVLQSGTDGTPVVLTNSNLADMSASIPDGTNIQGPAGWDGTIQPPMATSTSGTAPAGFSVGSNVISIGSPDGTLVFDKPVTILLTGVTGAVGYRPAGSNTWIQITNSCGDYTNPTSPAYPGECAVSNGTDTKILTFHFTSFGGLNVKPAPVVSSGNGPIVSSGGGVSSGPVAVALANNGGAAPTTGGSTGAAVSNSTGGQVLGAATYNFRANLSSGSRGADVTALQQFLIDGKYLSGSSTGYYGALTSAAVKKYQAAHNIEQTGTIGPKTRAALNAGVTPTMSDEQRSLLIVQLQTELKALLAQIAALTSATSTTQ